MTTAAEYIFNSSSKVEKKLTTLQIHQCICALDCAFGIQTHKIYHDKWSNNTDYPHTVCVWIITGLLVNESSFLIINFSSTRGSISSLYLVTNVFSLLSNTAMLH